MAYDIRTSIEIAAPPEKVWAVLADLASYPKWHPAYRSVTGQLTAGSKLTISSTASTGRPTTVKVKLVKVEWGTELCWVSRLLGITTVKRRFLLSPSAGGTLLVQTGTYRGLGGFRGYRSTPGAGNAVGNIQGTFGAINEALKRQAEA